MRGLLLILFVLAFLSMRAQERAVINSRHQIANLSRSALYLEDEGGNLSIDDILTSAAASRFQPVGNRMVNFGVTASAFWIKAPVYNANWEKLLVEVGNYSLTAVHFFEVQNGRVVNQLRTGNWQPIAERELRSPVFLFPLSISANEGADVYIRVMHYRGTQFSLKAGAISAFHQKDSRRMMMEGMYYGFMILMILYNLFLFFSLRDPAYLLYVLYVFFIALLNATINGYAFQYLWPGSPAFNQYDDVVACVAGSVGVLFAARFLNTRKNAPLLHRVFLALLLFYMVSTILILTRNFQPAVIMIEINTLVLVVCFFLAAWHTLRNGYRPAKFFLIAWSFLLLSVCVFILNNFNLIPSSTYATHSLQIGSAVEALLLSFALANRINVYKEEKRKAQLAMLHSLEKNKKLIVEQNIMLDKKVTERTVELRKANEELTTTVQNLQQTQAQLVQKEKMASLGELTAGIAHEIQNPLNFVNNFSELSTELVDELKSELQLGKTTELDPLADNLRANLQKILYHGRRAETIVKGMLEHSHLQGGLREEADLNRLVDESLKLAYHGLRATHDSFSAAIETHFDETLGKVQLVPGDIGRVLLNLFNNAFYSVREKKKSALNGYEPVISVSTQQVNGHAVIKVHDNGVGIPAKLKSKIYQPFFTTKPAGEGTGLGLSLSYDIITKEHNGSLYVETEEGEYAEFVIQLPMQ